jgi:hypothetical protein
MSRFKPNSKHSGATVLGGDTISAPRSALFTPALFTRPATAAASQPVAIAEDAGSPNMVATVGFVLYCAYLLSGLANDWAFRLIGNKAYISTITLILVPVAWLLSGNALRGLQRPVGRWWAFFLALLLLSTPFGVWKGGSVAMLQNYIPRSYLEFFYICAFVTSLRRCRYLMLVNIAGAVITLLTCFKFGGVPQDGSGDRFVIKDSLFFSNANDLALTLLMGITAFLFFVYQPGMGKRIVGVVGILFSIMYALKTGSRGGLLASVVLFGVIFFVSKNKLKVLILALPILAGGIIALPSATIHRLLQFGTEESASANSESDIAAINSRLERTELLKRSLYLTFTHPLLGVGPDQFATAVSGQDAQQGIHEPWLGTHNSYTQVSSECGIPALICYCAVLVFCFRSNWQLYRQTRDNPGLSEITNLSFCLFAGAFVYAIATTFFHIAYSGALPSLGGFSLALRLAAERQFARTASTQQAPPVYA